ncbi:hypothetical protein HELRODRAFT_168119 [Helobdella robusta]|uniref:Uncharacterized protein n=1 Tax=Helobdella robusta TaxID=6412 RepID=T1F068_HELRO|nr:hypothetical protein HELRODRAFT_168119 [Helobdella robusta]ESO10233.1 hypothetical protein HELRODRAFT_168119 [Helobdella robusta]
MSTRFFIQNKGDGWKVEDHKVHEGDGKLDDLCKNEGSSNGFVNRLLSFDDNFNDGKICLGLLNIRSIVSKSSDVYELLVDGLDVLVLTETWHGHQNDISVKSAMPDGYSYVDYIRKHDPYCYRRECEIRIGN